MRYGQHLEGIKVQREIKVLGLRFQQPRFNRKKNDNIIWFPEQVKTVKK